MFTSRRLVSHGFTALSKAFRLRSEASLLVARQGKEVLGLQRQYLRATAAREARSTREDSTQSVSERKRSIYRSEMGRFYRKNGHFNDIFMDFHGFLDLFSDFFDLIQAL